MAHRWSFVEEEIVHVTEIEIWMLQKAAFNFSWFLSASSYHLSWFFFCPCVCEMHYVYHSACLFSFFFHVTSKCLRMILSSGMFSNFSLNIFPTLNYFISSKRYLLYLCLKFHNVVIQESLYGYQGRCHAKVIPKFWMLPNIIT